MRVRRSEFKEPWVDSVKTRIIEATKGVFSAIRFTRCVSVRYSDSRKHASGSALIHAGESGGWSWTRLDQDGGSLSISPQHVPPRPSVFGANHHRNLNISASNPHTTPQLHPPSHTPRTSPSTPPLATKSHAPTPPPKCPPPTTPSKPRTQQP